MSVRVGITRVTVGFSLHAMCLVTPRSCLGGEVQRETCQRLGEVCAAWRWKA